MIPTPCAPSTSLSRIEPIDISPIVIPRSEVSPMRLCSTSTIDMCVTIPSRTPTIVQRSTMLISLSIENEMSMPCTHGPAGLETVQPSIITLARRTWMPSSSEPTTCTFSSIDVVRVLDVDAVLASVHGDVAQRDVVGANDDAAVDDAADERLRVPDHERPLHGAVQVHGRRADAVGGADAAGEERPRRPRPP